MGGPEGSRDMTSGYWTRMGSHVTHKGEAVMLNKSAGSIQTPSSRFQLILKPHHLILTIMWLLTTAVMVTMLWLGVRETGRYGEVRTILQAGYVAALIWYLIRSGPSPQPAPSAAAASVSAPALWRMDTCPGNSPAARPDCHLRCGPSFIFHCF